MSRVATDTGPLVALLNARDAHHRWARELLDDIAPPLLTCEAVMSEACFLVRKLRGGQNAVMDLFGRGVVKLAFRLETQIDSVRQLMARFASVPMSLADACLVRMTELDPQLTVLTLDRDFWIYRKNGKHAVPVLSPISARPRRR